MDRVIVTWGNNGKLMQSDLIVLDLLSELKVQPHCLGFTKSGCLRHPLYVLRSKQPNVYISG